MLTAQDHATIVRSYYDALNRREIDKNLSLVTDDVKWMNIPFNASFSGRKEYREYLENWTKAMPDYKVEIVNLIANGDSEWATIEFIGRGTHTAPLAGFQGTFPATNKKLELKFCELLRIKDGLIVEGHLYFDSASLMRQFGVLPQTPMPHTPTLQPVPAGR
jgi:steroid delta-isomerase-like uncharacterized protein